MHPDAVDRLISQWSVQRPDVDVSPLAVVSRLLMLYKHLEQGADKALARFDLALWQFDVLAVLRRSGPPFALTPTQIMQDVSLSSGAMTNRIDRLEQAGLVTREPDPSDRRGVLIRLTEAGKKLADDALAVRCDQAREVIAALTPDERTTLTELLRKLLVRYRGR